MFIKFRLFYISYMRNTITIALSVFKIKPLTLCFRLFAFKSFLSGDYKVKFFVVSL